MLIIYFIVTRAIKNSRDYYVQALANGLKLSTVASAIIDLS